MNFGKKVFLFCVGGAGYVGLELLWRGWSHISMFLAGGTCFLLLGGLRNRLRTMPIALRGVLCSGIITAVELTAGLVFNRSYQVWDYRALPLNLGGQICLPFSLFWIPLGLGAMELYAAVDQSVSKILSSLSSSSFRRPA